VSEIQVDPAVLLPS